MILRKTPRWFSTAYKNEIKINKNLQQVDYQEQKN
jgi:hypothetical protein